MDILDSKSPLWARHVFRHLRNLVSLQVVRAILCVIAFGLTLAIAISQDNWRHTERGWERMVVGSSEMNLTPLHAEIASPPISGWIQFHRCLVPIAIACFLATSGAWFLQALPTNRLNSSH